MCRSIERTSGITVEYRCHFQMRHGRKKLIRGKGTIPKPRSKPQKPTTIPPVVKLLALAHYYQRLLDTGEVKDYAEIAKLTGVSRARLTQVMNLTFLAPEIQRALLCTPFSCSKKTERSIRKIAENLLWKEQLEIWSF